MKNEIFMNAIEFINHYLVPLKGKPPTQEATDQFKVLAPKEQIDVLTSTVDLSVRKALFNTFSPQRQALMKALIAPPSGVAGPGFWQPASSGPTAVQSQNQGATAAEKNSQHKKQEKTEEGIELQVVRKHK